MNTAFLTLTGCLIPVLILVMGLMLSKKPPKDRMGRIGYRTPRSRRSQAAWEFANKLAGRYWVIEGAILLPLSALVLWFLHGAFEADSYSTAVCVLLIAQAILICIPILPVEKALKNKFGD